MNFIKTLDTTYLNRASRTLETVQVSRTGYASKLFWVYNYEGVHFRVFTSNQQVLDFLENKSHEFWVDFEDDETMEEFLFGVTLFSKNE
jgi:hypothetical protein